MKQVILLARKDIGEAFSSKTTYSYLLILAFISLPYFDGTRSLVRNISSQGGTPADIRVAAQLMIDSMFYTLPLIMIMLICGVFAAYAVVVDKNKRTLESLMATPLSLRQVWFGKSLAVTLPSVIIGVGAAVLVMAVVNIFIFSPVAGFIVPGYRSLIGGFLLVPLLTLLTVLIVTMLQLVMTNPRLASFIFSAVFISIYFSNVTGVTAAWDFSLIYLAFIGFLAILTLLLSRFLTKEKIVLSSKG